MAKWIFFFLFIPFWAHANPSKPIEGPLLLRSEVHKRFEKALNSNPSFIPAAFLKERRYKIAPLFQKGGGGMRFNMNY